MTTVCCYAAGSRYMLQTAVSALQARSHLPADVLVTVVFVHRGPHDDAELRAFEAVLVPRGVQVLRMNESVLGGLNVRYARYFVSSVLPNDVDRVLYLDGDTQVIGDLAPLVQVELGERTVAATRDPMVLLRHLDPVRRLRIDRWMSQAGVGADRRNRYANSGMFVTTRSRLDALARMMRELGPTTRSRFGDQDAFNVIVRDDLRLISMTWNFPGFCLGTAVEAVVDPTVVHFMSEPRPWSAPLPPWGERYHEPYRTLVHEAPSLTPYRPRLRQMSLARYRVQQAAKAAAERPALMGQRAAAATSMLEDDLDLLIPSGSRPRGGGEAR